MNKKIVQAVLERSRGICEYCGVYKGDSLELHHIIGGNGKRKQHESIESVIALCYEHHRGTNGVHGKNGRELDLKLKRKLQQTYIEQGYTEIKVRKLMGGKLY